MDAEKTARALETIERNARLQTQLIDDLLDVAKILRGKLKLDIAVVDLTFVIESAIETVQSAIDAKKISLHASLPDIGRVRGDAARLQQVVWNLLSNAIKFTPQRGQITVQLLRVDACAHIQVTDTGKGIHPEFLPYIFESFRQEDTSITRQFGGLGLGLAIVRHLVEAHGGTITAKSPGEGQGTMFMVSLPLESPTPDQPSTHGDATADTDLSEVRVLAVEDNPDTLELLQICLAQYGAEIRIFDSAAAALDALKTFKPDVLLCDIGMPNMDGYTLMRTIRSLSPEQGGQIPAIALTAYVREEDCQKALENGFQTHLAKPVDPNLLALTIAKVATP
jgi:CheY-like chemotaxis protein/two-component sensor histidine kinase